MSEPNAGRENRPSPEEDPSACSLCGCHIGLGKSDYCDPCAREIGAKPPLRECLGCGRRGEQEHMAAVDISSPDEYYPTIRYLCRSCSKESGAGSSGGSA